MKKGKDVSSDTLLDHLFWSKHPSLNIKKRGVLEITSSGDDNPTPTVTATYNHNFGYKPQFMAFTQSYQSTVLSKFSFADYVNLDYSVVADNAGSNLYERLYAYVTDTQLVVQVYLADVVSGNEDGIAHTYNIDYLLFMEEAVTI